MTDTLEEYFKNINRLGLTDDDMDKPVFRFISLENLTELLVNKVLTLVKTKLWDDPYENYILKCNVFYKNQEVNLQDLQEQIFGQCWTFIDESDAFWRIYSADKKGIRIKTTLRKLRDTTYKMGQSYLCKVTYDTTETIKKHFGSLKNGDTLLNTKNLLETFLWKRNAFEHEKEVRILYMIDTGSIDTTKLTQDFPLEPNSFIDEILFDPRLDTRTENVFRHIISSLGYVGQVNKSTLYSVEQVTISMY